MMNRMQYQLEQTGETATLYLAGGLGDRDLPALIGVCDALPSTIRTFRLDLQAIGMLSAESTGVVRQLLQHWRSSRRGEFRLSTKHLVATCREAERPELTAAAGWAGAPLNAALTATYL
jgi:ABC-type transporter Mla MlaB component